MGLGGGLGPGGQGKDVRGSAKRQMRVGKKTCHGSGVGCTGRSGVPIEEGGQKKDRGCKRAD